jgi:hypothetical protein
MKSHKDPGKSNQSNSDKDDDKKKKGGQSKTPPKFALTSSTGKLPDFLKPKKTIFKDTSKRKYGSGTHGYKKTEQSRLKGIYGAAVSGGTHQSEHPIGFEPINQTNETKRGGKGRTKELENKAPAYQEEYDAHRQHIGTGNRGYVDESGFNAREYRDTQRSFLLQNEPGIAIQLNQLGYGQDKNFGFSTKPSQLQSNESFFNMVQNVGSFSIANDTKDKQGNVSSSNQLVTFKPSDKAEMLTSRATALLKRYLNPIERSLFTYVIDGRIDFNYFVHCCQTGDFSAILDELGFSEFKEEFSEHHEEYRKNDRYNPEDDDDLGGGGGLTGNIPVNEQTVN